MCAPVYRLFFFVTGVLVLFFFEGFEGFLLSFLEVSPFRVCFVFFCAPEDVSF